MNTVPTPYGSVRVDPNRWTDEELSLARAGLCPWQVAYGTPYTDYCGDPGTPFCPTHLADEREGLALHGGVPAWESPGLTEGGTS